VIKVINVDVTSSKSFMSSFIKTLAPTASLDYETGVFSPQVLQFERSLVVLFKSHISLSGS
jgi:hypothetical protein